MFDLFKRRKGRGARRRATPSMFAEFLEYFGEAPVLEDRGGRSLRRVHRRPGRPVVRRWSVQGVRAQ